MIQESDNKQSVQGRMVKRMPKYYTEDVLVPVNRTVKMSRGVTMSSIMRCHVTLLGREHETRKESK